MKAKAPTTIWDDIIIAFMSFKKIIKCLDGYFIVYNFVKHKYLL